jgi:ATP-dependent RNA helicase RhlE
VSFNQLQLIEPVLKALQHEGYTTPTPIQAQAIPPILQERDLLGCAQTGTGKTAAFTIPILQLMQGRQQEKQPRHIKALILTPTRELAIQIGESIEAYGRFLKLRHHVIFGGVSQHSQVQALKSGLDILVATPGRLLDLMQQGFIALQHIEFFVLDEADRMLDMGFVHDVKKVIAKLPAKRQTLFFSATMPAEAQQLADMLLTNPVKVAVTPVSSTAELVQQQVYHTGKQLKLPLLLHLLENPAMNSVLVFVQMKHVANRIAEKLNRAGVRAAAIHGNKSQNARQEALEGFKNRKVRVLVATDIAARGIDIDNLAYVVNYELPNVPETYVHRIGRTGRAGASGLAISFCDASEKEFLRDIQRLIGKNIPVIEEHPFPPGAPVPAEVMQAPQVQQHTGNRHQPQRQHGRTQNRPAQQQGQRQQPAQQSQQQQRSQQGQRQGGQQQRQTQPARHNNQQQQGQQHKNNQGGQQQQGQRNKPQPQPQKRPQQLTEKQLMQQEKQRQQKEDRFNRIDVVKENQPEKEINYNSDKSFNSKLHYNNEHFNHKDIEVDRW